MLLQEKLYSAEEFWEMARLPENEGRRLELDEGVIVDMGSSRPINTVIAGLVIHHLNAYAVPRNAGWVTVPDGGFKLASKKARQPDAAFVSKERLPVLPDEFRIAPDLAVEVVSPNEDVFKKVNEYLLAGSRMVWVIYPDDKLVYVCTLDDDANLRIQRLGIDGTLEGGDVLPGFRLPVRDIFPA